MFPDDFPLIDHLIPSPSSPELVNQNIVRRDALAGPVQPAFDYIIANPPFGPSYRKETVVSTLRGSKTEFLFADLAWQSLSSQPGRAALILPPGFFFNAQRAPATIRQTLIERFRIEAIIALPPGLFDLPKKGTRKGRRRQNGGQVLILLFSQGETAQEIRFFELASTDPQAFVALLARLNGQTIEHPDLESWNVSTDELAGETFNLMPNRYKPLPPPQEPEQSLAEIWAEIESLEAESRKTMAGLRQMMAELGIMTNK